VKATASVRIQIIIHFLFIDPPRNRPKTKGGTVVTCFDAQLLRKVYVVCREDQMKKEQLTFLLRLHWLFANHAGAFICCCL